MKKLALFLALAVMLTGCGHIVTGHDGLISAAREHALPSNASTADIRIAGSFDIDDQSLVWFTTGSGEQNSATYPIEFQSLGDGRFRFVQAYKPMERGMGLYALNWKNGYCFLIDNEDCTALSIADHHGTQIIDVTQYPFMYRYEPLPSAFTYLFLDEQGNEL